MRRTVLYIDDAPQLPDRTREVLDTVGCDLVHLPDPADLPRVLRDRPPALVLIEVLTAGCDGFELIEQLVATGLPVVVVTRGQRSPELYGRSLELGICDFLCKPVLEAQVLEAVLAFASDGTAVVPEPVAEAPETRPESGDLAWRPLPEIFAELHGAGASGVLRLKRGPETRSVQFRNGSPVVVSGPKPRELFVDYVLRTGWIKQEHYALALDHSMSGMCDARAALEAMGALTSSQADQAARDQARDVLLDMFGWSDGMYEFHPRKRLTVAGAFDLTCDPSAILLHAVRRSCPESVVRAALAARGSAYALASPDLDRWLDGVDVSQVQRQKLAALAGDRTLGEALEEGELEPRLLYALVLLGAVLLEGAPVVELTDVMKSVPAPTPAPVSAAAPSGASANDVSAWLEALAERIKQHDDFELFGIGSGTSDAEVQAAYRALIESFPSIVPELDDLAGRVRTRIDQAYARVKSRDLRAAFLALRVTTAKQRAAEPEASRAVEAESWFRKGQARLDVNDLEGAIEAIGMATHLDPDQGEYAAHLGYAMYRSNPDSEIIRREALEHIAKGVKLAPESVTPLLFLGRVFRQSGDAAMAVKVFRRALALKPDDHAILEELCLVQVDGGKKKKGGFFRRLRRS